MSGSGESIVTALTLSLWSQDGEAFAHLSDGLARQAFGRLGPVEATADGGNVLPAAIVDALRHAPIGPLRLQVAPELDALPWESGGDGVWNLGARFAVTRHRVGEDAPAAAAEPAMLPAGELGLWLAPGCDDPALHRPGQWRVAPPGTAAMLARPGVVWLGAVGHGRPLPVSPGWERAEPQALLAGQVGSAADVRSMLAALPPTRAGLLLQVGADDMPARWLAPLCEALSGGCTVAEAVRRVRAAVVGGPPPDLRLYRGGEQALVDAPAGDGDDGYRQVTAMSFDLVDSTGLMHRLGEERYGVLLDSYHRQCAAVIRLHGGTVDDPQGDDGLMSYFGFPVALEGSARRAVRAALELVRGVREMGLEVRVGIATGRVAVTRGQPVGLSVHLAARVRAQAQPNTVLVAGSTWRLAGDEVAATLVAGGVELKGIAGTQDLHRIDGLRAHDDESAALTPFVGRESELSRLHAAWARSAEGAAEVVFVSAEAGMGKSRLLREFGQALERQGAPVLACTGREEWRGSAYLALIEPLREMLSLTPQADAAACQAALQLRLPPAVKARWPQAETWLAGLLTAGPEAAPARQRLPDLLVDWVRAEARLRPACIVFDDVHWLDPSTREFVERLIAASAGDPLLCVVAARTEARRGWRPSRVSTAIELQGLSQSLAWQLVRQAAPGGALDEGAVRLLASRADGVPLFLEESARMAQELRADARGHAATALQMAMPASLQDVLMARLDRIGRGKRVAQVGAVLGREFPAPLLHAVLDAQGAAGAADDVPARLDELHAAGLLLGHVGVRGQLYRFKHALVRDVAYQSIWDRDRRAIHETVAAVLRERFPALARERPEQLAHHLAEAGRLDEALESWEAAARVAAARSENQEAIGHATTALSLLPRLPATPWRDQAELRLQLLLAARLIAAEGYGAEPVERAYLRAAELGAALGDERARTKIQLGLEAYYFMRADFDRAREIAEQARDAAAGAPDPMQRMQSLWALANVDWHQGRLLPALDAMDRTLAVYRSEFHRPAAVQDPGVMCLCYSAWGYWERGDTAEALRRMQRVLALSQSLGHRFSIGQAEGFAASVHQFCGQWRQALAHAERAIEVCDDSGFSVWLAHAVITRGRVRAQLGEVDEGLAEMRRGYAMWTATGAIVTRPLYLAMQAEGERLAGRDAAAEVLLTEALAIADRGHEHYHRAEVLRGLGELAAARGDAAVAAGWLSQALAQALAQGKRVFALRAALALLRLDGDGHPADDDAAAARGRLRLLLSELPADTELPERAEAAARLAA